MTLKQRICGFLGHSSNLETAYRNHENGNCILTDVRLRCKKCGFVTKWFQTSTANQMFRLLHFDRVIYSNGVSDESKASRII